MKINLSLRQRALLLILVILTVDQVFKFWIKTHMSIGDEIRVLGRWFILHFTENPGMAFGMRFWGIWGKMALSLFRLAAIVAIAIYIHRLIKHNARPGLVLGVSLILAGAIGNIIDSAFYGLIFDTGTTYNAQHGEWMMYDGVSKANFTGYAGFLKGCVVDMLYFPIIDTTYPSWVPIVGGQPLIFFRPVFNIADSAITTGVFYLLIFQRNILFGKHEPKQPEAGQPSPTGA